MKWHKKFSTGFQRKKAKMQRNVSLYKIQSKRIADILSFTQDQMNAYIFRKKNLMISKQIVFQIDNNMFKNVDNNLSGQQKLAYRSSSGLFS